MWKALNSMQQLFAVCVAGPVYSFELDSTSCVKSLCGAIPYYVLCVDTKPSSPSLFGTPVKTTHSQHIMLCTPSIQYAILNAPNHTCHIQGGHEVAHPAP